MEVQAIQGYFKNGLFYKEGKQVVLPEQTMVIVNVLNIPVTSKKDTLDDKKQAFIALDGVLAGHDVDLGQMREERILSK